MLRRLTSIALQQLTKRTFSAPQFSRSSQFKPIICSVVLQEQKRFFGSDHSFEVASDETLESLCEHFEIIIDDNPKLAEADVTLASGVLKLVLPDNHGTYVINKQSPNQQIWLSSPKSGPFRYDLQGNTWIYKRTQESLHSLLNREIGKDILGFDDAGFEKCFLGGDSQD